MTKTTVQSASILLVEDDPDDALLTCRAFEKAHVWNRIDVAKNAEEAWQYLTNAGPYTDQQRYPTPILVLIDLNMPGMDGRDLLEKIHQTESLSSVHVVVSSNSDFEKDMELVRSLGAAQYIIKPVQKSSVLQIIGMLKKVQVILGTVES